MLTQISKNVKLSLIFTKLRLKKKNLRGQQGFPAELKNRLAQIFHSAAKYATLRFYK